MAGPPPRGARSRGCSLRARGRVGVALPLVEHRSVVPGSKTDGTSRVSVVRMTPAADGCGANARHMPSPLSLAP